MDIPLGSQVVDAVTGFTGIVTQRCKQFSGNIQYAVQPRCKEDGTLPEALYLDYHQLVITGPGESHRVVQPDDDCMIQVGDEVRDKVTDFAGIAIAEHTFMNGCIFFSVAPKVRREALLNDVPAGNMLDSKRLVLADPKLRMQRLKAKSPDQQTGWGGEPEATPEPETPKKPTGGPSSVVKRPVVPR